MLGDTDVVGTGPDPELSHRPPRPDVEDGELAEIAIEHPHAAAASFVVLMMAAVAVTVRFRPKGVPHADAGARRDDRDEDGCSQEHADPTAVADGFPMTSVVRIRS